MCMRNVRHICWWFKIEDMKADLKVYLGMHAHAYKVSSKVKQHVRKLF